MTVYHGYVASSYHTGIISGFMLISSYMESVASSGKMVSTSSSSLGVLQERNLEVNYFVIWNFFSSFTFYFQFI